MEKFILNPTALLVASLVGELVSTSGREDGDGVGSVTGGIVAALVGSPVDGTGAKVGFTGAIVGVTVVTFEVGDMVGSTVVILSVGDTVGSIVVLPGGKVAFVMFPGTIVGSVVLA